MKMRISMIRTGLVLAIAAVMMGGAAQAKQIVWDGEGTEAAGTTNWNHTANWVDDATFANNDDVVFYTGTPTTFNIGLGARRTVNSVTFNADADTGMRIYGTSNQGLTIAGGGITVAADADGHHVIDAPITNSASQTWAINTTTGSLTVNSSVTQRGGQWTIAKTGDGLLLLGGNVQTRLFDIQAGTVKVVGGSARLHDNDTQMNIAAGAVMDYDNLGSDTFRSLSGAGTIINMNGRVVLRPVDNEVTVFTGDILDGTGPASFEHNFDSRGGNIDNSTGVQRMESELSYTGWTYIDNATLVLGGQEGSAQNTSTLRIGRVDRATRTARVVLDNSDGNKDDRLNPSAGILFRAGAELKMIGNAGVGSSQTTGPWTNNSGRASIVIEPQAGGPTVLMIGGAEPVVLAGLGGSKPTFHFNGISLGATAGANVAQIKATAGLTLSHAGAAGTTQVGVLPWAVGTTGGIGESEVLVTYDAATGVRPVSTATEFATAITAERNVLLIGNAAVSADTTIRALQLESAGSTLTIGEGRTLTVQSGAIAVPTSFSHIISGGSLNFGNNAAVGYDGYIHNAGTLRLDTAIVGNGANITHLSFSGPGTTTLTQSYGEGIGQTTVVGGGRLALDGTVSVATGDLFLDQGELKITDGSTAWVGNIQGYGSSAIVLGSGSTLTVEARFGTAYSYWGAIEGPADSTLIKTGGNTLTVRNQAAFEGSLIHNQGTLSFRDRGAIQNVASIRISNNARLLSENNVGGNSENLNNRISTTAPIALDWGQIEIQCSGNANHSQTLGSLTVEAGRSMITVRTNTTANTHNVTVTANQIARENNASLLIRADNLAGAAGGWTRLRVTADNEPVLSHAYAAESVNMGVVPWIIGDNRYNGTGAGLITYQDNTVGFRLLAGNEYNTIDASVTAQNIGGTYGNLFITNNIQGVTLTGNTAVRGLVTDTRGASGTQRLNLNGNQLTIESGVWLHLATRDLHVNPGVGGSITFGPNDAVGYQGNIHLTTSSRMRLNAPIVDNGANAVSLVINGDSGHFMGMYSASTYSGDTTIGSGYVFLIGTPTLDGVETAKGINILPVTTRLSLGSTGATLELNSVTQTVAGVSGVGRILSNAGQTETLLTINQTDADNPMVYSGFITNNATRRIAIVKTGAGVQEFNGALDYYGTTTIQAGKLVVNAIHTGAGIYTNMNGGTLGGSGLIDGEVVVMDGGRIAPGNSIGTMTVRDLRLDDGAILEMELSNDTPILSDRLVLTGNLFAGYDEGGFYWFDFKNSGYWDGENDTVYTLLTFQSGANVDGIDASKFKYTNLGGGYGGTIDVSDTAITLTVIPEPVSLGALGAIALMAILRRRARR